MTRFLMLCPSRRPAGVAMLTKSWQLTVAHLGTAQLQVILDADDPARAEYPALPAYGSYRVLADSPHQVAAIVNDAARIAVADGWDAVGFMGDDHRMRSDGWDAMIAAEVERGPAVIYGNDLHQGQALPTAVVITRDILEAVGYFCPPTQHHLYLDNFWRLLGEDLGCLRYLPNLIIEHMHPHAGKAPWDDGYTRVNDPALYSRDEAAWHQFVVGRWPADLERARAALGLTVAE